MRRSGFKFYLLVQERAMGEIKDIHFRAISFDLSSVTLKIVESL